MFIKCNKINGNDDISLYFLKSVSVQAYPCGRRRAKLDTEATTYIPFDPEARLNTEANVRKHSSLNGYTQTYLNRWDNVNNSLSLVLSGYFFNVLLTDFVNTPTAFAENAFSTDTGGTDLTTATKLFANIRLENVKLFNDGARDLTYTTMVLKNQTADLSSDAIDLLVSRDSENEPVDITDDNNYYFSGLSFSTEPLSAKASGEGFDYIKDGDGATRSTTTILKDGILHQQVISLCILEKVNGLWQIHQPALLPSIEHGDSADSVKITELEIDRAKINGVSVMSLDVVPSGNAFKLVFSSNKEKAN